MVKVPQVPAPWSPHGAAAESARSESSSARSNIVDQYHHAKRLAPDALLLFRLGDFYELFHDDARTASRLLGLTLTTRDKGDDPGPMAGFPYHQLDGYLAKLIAAGYRAAICETVEATRETRLVAQVPPAVPLIIAPGDQAKLFATRKQPLLFEVA